MKWLDKLKVAIGAQDRAKQIPSGRNEPESFSRLFPREKEVFLHLLDGEKMKDIADELHIKTSTVNGYCREIYKKLGVNSKAQLILKYSNSPVEFESRIAVSAKAENSAAHSKR